jgi:hypothetical protein
VFLKNLPENPLQGIEAFERLLAEQALRHLSRECWRTMMAAQILEPRGPAARTGARLNDLIKRQYVQIIRTYQACGPSGTIEDLLRVGLPHIALILRGLLLDKRSKPPRRMRME